MGDRYAHLNRVFAEEGFSAHRPVRGAGRVGIMGEYEVGVPLERKCVHRSSMAHRIQQTAPPPDRKGPLHGRSRVR
ncbi:hypothetical protein, partial [Streptomyces adelaidensis]|uniref:hypothetical protein n=1 Tax=Streptomyces adelaidensis TaxID=2796465 RepID=UPI001F3CFD92